MERKIWGSNLVDAAVFITAVSFSIHFHLLFKGEIDLAHWSLIAVWPHFPLVLQAAIDTVRLRKDGKITDKFDYLAFSTIVIVWIFAAIAAASMKPFDSMETNNFVAAFMLGNLVLVPFFVIVTYSLKKLMGLSRSAKLIHFGISLFYTLLAGVTAMMIMAMHAT